MNNDAFLRHHGLTANPFRGEEARQDVIFDRIEHECRHPDFDKIVGDLDRPSSSVVFGERGSGSPAPSLSSWRASPALGYAGVVTARPGQPRPGCYRGPRPCVRTIKPRFRGYA